MKTTAIRNGSVSSCFEVHSFGSGSPVFAFTGGIHGNECTGVYTAARLTEFFHSNPPLRGTVKVIPLVNPAAMRARQRCNPLDGMDVNRVFPGDPNGSLSMRIADAVWKETSDADFIVDLHCCNPGSIPYILSVYSESFAVRRLAEEIPLPAAVHSEGTEGQLFTEACRQRGQAALIIEMPSATSAGGIREEIAEQCFQALLNMLRAHGVIEGAPQGKPPRFYGKLQRAPLPAGKIFRPVAARGDFAAAGDVIGEVDGAPVRIPADGLILSIRAMSYVFPNDTWSCVYAEPETPAR